MAIRTSISALNLTTRLNPRNIRAYFRSLYDTVVHFFELVPYSLLIFGFMRQIINRGAYQITTPFRYSSPENEFVVETEFRTLVQLDGDCLRVLPNIRPKPVAQKVDWIAAYREAHQVHQQKTDNDLQKIARSWSFWAALFSAPAFLLANYNLIHDVYVSGYRMFDEILFSPLESWEWFLNFAVAGASYYFRRRVIGFIMNNLIQITMFLTKVVRWFKATRKRMFS